LRRGHDGSQPPEQVVDHRADVWVGPNSTAKLQADLAVVR
jgi:hypothetical protein